MQFLALNVEDILRNLWGSLCQFIYRLIAWLYDLFINISRVEFLTTENIKPIYQRITMILTIVMVFYVTFQVVKYVIQPEEFSDKEKGAGKLTLKMVLVVILIAFVPSIFSWSYKLQNAIFDNQIFTKVILEAKNEKQMDKIIKKAKEAGMIENEDFFCIRDACLTELTPDETGTRWTCIGFKPMDSEKIDPITKKLQLFKD